METTTTSKTTPKDFFLWLGAIIALYGSVTSIIALKFEYINYLFPDPLAYYGDPYGGAVRLSMATLIVLVPTMIILFRLIRKSIIQEPGKATIWVRRWALVLTLFLATVAGLIDLATLINTFLGGEITMRFGLKVLAVLCVAIVTFAYFYLDIKGYWARNPKHGVLAGVAVGLAALASIVAGFFIIGTPGEVRLLRFDDQKVQDLQSLQSQVLYHYQQKKALPVGLSELNDPLSYYEVPLDPQTSDPYTYEVVGPLSFKLCATFNKKSSDMKGRGSMGGDIAYPSEMGFDGSSNNWEHEPGETCYTRTIDPDKYPQFSKPL